jgi:hypothetical protein
MATIQYISAEKPESYLVRATFWSADYDAIVADELEESHFQQRWSQQEMKERVST